MQSRDFSKTKIVKKPSNTRDLSSEEESSSDPSEDQDQVEDFSD